MVVIMVIIMVELVKAAWCCVRALPRFTALCASECRDFVLKWSKT